jgi:octopine/nopaline transport system substrate-binding protein
MWRPDRIARLALALSLGLGLVSGAAPAEPPTRIRIATEGAYPPWNFVDGTGALIGFEVDLAHDLCRRIGAVCELVARDWESIVPGLRAGDYDAIMDGLTITEARAQLIRFSISYAKTPAAFAVRKASPLAGLAGAPARLDLGELDAGEQAALDALRNALAGKTVGVEVASPAAGFLKTFLADAVESRAYVALDSLDADLEAGRIDLALASMSHWQPLLAGERGRSLTLIGPRLTGGPFGAGVGVGIRQADADLAARFNAAIGAARADGTIARLAQQWFGYDLSS